MKKSLLETFKRIGGLRLNEADVFGGDAEGASTEPVEDDSRAIEKLRDKFEGVLDPIIDLIKKKEDLNTAVSMLITKAEETTPNLGRKTKTLLLKTVKDL